MKKLVLLVGLLGASFAFADSVFSESEEDTYVVENYNIESNQIVGYSINNLVLLPVGGGIMIYSCSVTVSAGSGTSTGYGVGNTLEEACHAATSNALTHSWDWVWETN